MKRSALLLSLILLLLTACGNTLEITKIDPDKEVSLTQAFTIEFNKDVAPATKQNIWLTDGFLDFEPKIPGKYKWISANTLIFSPDFKLNPIETYKVKVNEKALFGNKELSISGDEVEFSTPNFKLDKAEFFWANIPHQYYKAGIQVNLLFNYEVVPELLNKYLEVKINNQLISNYKIITQSKSEKVNINIGEISQTDKEQKIEVKVKEGFESVYGKKGLEKDKEFTYNLPPITQLEISGYASGFDGANGWMEISTTQSVEESVLKNYISFNPTKDVKYTFYDNKFRIDGNFENAKTVTVKIKKGLSGSYGGILQEDYEQDISFINLEPSINFKDRSGKYMKYSGERNIEVLAVNTDEVEVEVNQIFKNNLLYYLNQNNDRYYEPEFDGYYNDYYTSAEQYGKTLYKETKTLKNEQNWLEKFQVNLNKIVPDKNSKGLFLINISSTQDRWISTSKTIALTDLGLITKKSGNDIIVYVNSIAEAMPLKDVDISVISTNNQTILSGKTDEMGIIHFIDYKSKIGDFTPRLIVAETSQDFNYLDLDNSLIETSRYDVTGMSEVNDKYLAYIYGERSLYRPGETAHISAIIRNQLMEPVTDFPVIVKVMSPVGSVFREFRSNVNQEGSFELQFEIPDYALTGMYKVELYTGSYELIGNYLLNIEDFVPDKIRLLLSSNNNIYSPNQKVSINIDAEFLFGSKASGLDWTADFYINRKDYFSKSHKDYNFTNDKESADYFEPFSTSGQLDDNGKATADYMIASNIKTSGYIEGYAVVSVFDLNGRTVTRSYQFKIYPNQAFLGIKSQGYYFGTNQNITFKTVAIDKNDKPISNINYTARLIRYEWKTVLKQDYSEKFYYASEKKQFIEWEKNITSSNSAKDLKFALSKSGEYELKLFTNGDTNIYTSTNFYAYSWASSSASTFEVNKEGRIEIVTDKENYQPGEKAKVLFTTPFSGKMLVTLERNGVYYSEYVNVENRTAEMTIPITDEYLPNVFISATLFKKHNPDKSTPFFVGHGYASVKVDNPDNQLPVEIICESQIKPNTTQKVIVKSSPNKDIHLTLAAVDEGILSIKNYKSPNPYNYFYTKRALKTESYDLYKFLLPEIVTTNPSTGGGDFLMDMESMVNSRTNPIKSKRFKPFSYWSGIVKTNSSGQVTIPIDIPNINTEVRLMAVAYKGAKFGSAEKAMKVKNDIIIEPEIPRFLSPNDELTMPVSIMNTTNSDMSIKVNVNAWGCAWLSSPDEQSINVPANKYVTVEFKVKAKQEIGIANIRITANGKVKVIDDTEISVRPASPLISDYRVGTIYPGQEVNLGVSNDFIKSMTNQSLSISKLPALSYAKYLKELLSYPHGCIEQTVSKAFPQLYFAELAALIAPNKFSKTNPIYYINEAIHKVESMQLWDGGIRYWQEDNSPNKWASVYSAHFLVAAQKAGYAVNHDVLNNLLKYISKLAKTPGTYDYYSYSGKSSRTSRKIANKEIIYSLFVLSLAGRNDISTMNYYMAHQELLTMDTRYLLAGAYALAGKISTFYSLIPSGFNPEFAERDAGNSFDSEVRANALMLYVLLEVDPNNAQVPIIMRYLNTNASKVYSTQDMAFTMLALGKAASIQANSNFNIDIFANNNKIGTFTGEGLSIAPDKLTNSAIKLKATNGTGSIYYFYTAEGIKYNNAIAEKDSYLKIRRYFYDLRSKKSVDLNNVKQGQLLICKLTLESGNRSIENIAISALLPAGFEIENPRLSEVQQTTWKTNSPMKIRHLDIRDDRLLLFTDINANKYSEYYYMVRVTNQGIYTLPPVIAEAMYAPEYASIFGNSFVKIFK